MEYTKHVADRWFLEIKAGRKTIEGRLRKGDWLKLKIGDTIVFTSDTGETCKVEVVDLHAAKDFVKLFIAFGEALLPGVTSSSEAKSVYGEYFSDELIEKYEVVGIEIKLI